MPRKPESMGPIPERKESKEEIIETLSKELPELAKANIEQREGNENFLKNPDDYLEHEPNWHQFGIVTHTEKFSEFYGTEAKGYFERWGVADKLNKKLSEKIGDRTKAELLEISMPLHDIGKFARGFKEKDGKIKPDYKGHEAKSEKIILEGNAQGELEGLGLSEEQVEYIGRCAGLHYELGKVRDEAKKTDLGYTIAFTESEQFKEFCDQIASDYPDFKEEIGILFLCDSLAKTDVVIDAETDQEVDEKAKAAEEEVKERNLNPKLIAAIKQRSVNIAVVKEYFENIL